MKKKEKMKNFEKGSLDLYHKNNNFSEENLAKSSVQNANLQIGVIKKFKRTIFFFKKNSICEYRFFRLRILRILRSSLNNRKSEIYICISL
jgi:hypothetical protein